MGCERAVAADADPNSLRSKSMHCRRFWIRWQRILFEIVTIDLQKRKILEVKQLRGCLWARRDLNPQPTDYESAALTVELQAPVSRCDRLRGEDTIEFVEFIEFRVYRV